MSIDNLYNKSFDHYFQDYRTELYPSLPDKFRTILDIGCGTGNFLQGIYNNKNSDIEAWGIDPYGKPKSDSILDKFIPLPIEQAIHELPELYFDVIYMNDVIEHLENPEEVIDRLKSKLTKGGYLIMSIPNIRYISNLKHMLLDKDFRYEESGIRDNTHLRFFTQKSILRMADKLGFNVIDIFGVNPHPKQNLFNIVTLGTMRDAMYLQFCVKLQVR